MTHVNGSKPRQIIPENLKEGPDGKLYHFDDEIGWYNEVVFPFNQATRVYAYPMPDGTVFFVDAREIEDDEVRKEIFEQKVTETSVRIDEMTTEKASDALEWWKYAAGRAFMEEPYFLFIPPRVVVKNETKEWRMHKSEIGTFLASRKGEDYRIQEDKETV